MTRDEAIEVIKERAKEALGREFDAMFVSMSAEMSRPKAAPNFMNGCDIVKATEAKALEIVTVMWT